MGKTNLDEKNWLAYLTKFVEQLVCRKGPKKCLKKYPKKVHKKMPQQCKKMADLPDKVIEQLVCRKGRESVVHHPSHQVPQLVSK